MHTVLILDNKMAELYDERKSLFLPMFCGEEFSVCIWNADGGTIDEAVPGLKEAVGKKEQWRAAVVFDPGYFISGEEKAALVKRNPFDFISAGCGVEAAEESEVPLIRLTHMLAGYPRLGIKCFTYPEGQNTCKAIEYGEETKQRQRSLEKKYRQLEYTACQLWLIAVRRAGMHGQEEILGRAVADGRVYGEGEFCIRNNYAHQSRFMCFDISGFSDRMRDDEIFRLWITVLTLITNEVPSSALRAYRLYRIDCRIDMDRLKDDLSFLYTRLNLAKAAIMESRMVAGEKSFKPAENILKKQHIPVVYEQMPASGPRIPPAAGLVTDCPLNEAEYWHEQSSLASAELRKYLRRPRRAIKEAAEFARKEEERFFQDTYELDEFQMEDIREADEKIEEDILNSMARKILDIDAYENELAGKSAAVKKVISKRMTKRQALYLGLLALALYLAGFLPCLVMSLADGGPVARQSIVMAALALMVAAAAEFITLLVFRHILKRSMITFNEYLLSVTVRINKSAAAFEEYLSKIVTKVKAQSIIQGTKAGYADSKSFEVNLKMHEYAANRAASQAEEYARSFQIDLNTSGPGLEDEYYDYDIPPDRSGLYHIRQCEGKSIPINKYAGMLTTGYDFLEQIIIEPEKVYEEENECLP